MNLIETKNKNICVPEFGFDKILNATNYFLKKNNPFSENDFLFLKKNFEILEEYNNKQNNNDLNEKEKKKFSEIKENIKNKMVYISEENAFFKNCYEETDIIKQGRLISYFYIAGSCCTGFLAGFIPIPFADLAIVIPLSFMMVKQIANNYGVYLKDIPFSDILKLTLGIGANVVNDTSNAILEVSSSKLAKEGGKKIMDNFGEQALKNNPILICGKGKMKKIIKNIAQPTLEKEGDNIFYKVLQFFSQNSKSFKSGIEESIKSEAGNFATKYSKTLINNPKSVKMAHKVVNEIAEKRATTLSNNAIKFISEGTSQTGKNFSHVIPIISGFINCYSSYSNGKSTIEYFEDYVMKTMGIPIILRRKKDYENIFAFIDKKIDNYLKNKNQK